MHSLLTAFFSTVFSNEGDKLRKEGKLAKAIEAYKTDYIKNPTNSKDDQLNALRKISEQYKLNDLLTKFLSFLVSKRRFFYVDNILKSFVETCSAKRGELKAELTSAKDLTEDEVNSIKEELTENFSSKIKLNYKYDKSLIGGLIVQVGSTMVDTSIKNKLQQIENRMIEA